ncbi:conjugal transfer protein, partial [Salmonella enterica subsp. enterica]|nr:conjugal transfer protein [Salmonella enterica subsp. enterica serovar Farmsen]
GKSLPRFWPADFFPVFYTCHLAVLGVLALSPGVISFIRTG